MSFWWNNMPKAKIRETLVKVATMYYVGNRSQEEIANTLNFSRTTD
jgi:DNA-binding transcriptional regulator LsrR (DeoR family)